METDTEMLQQLLKSYQREHARLVELLVAVNNALRKQNYGIAMDLLSSEISFGTNFGGLQKK